MDDELRALLDEQIAYYRARGPAYLDEALGVWWRWMVLHHGMWGGLAA